MITPAQLAVRISYPTYLCAVRVSWYLNMANLSTSWKSAFSSASRPLSPLDIQAPSPISRPSSPSPQAAESATTVAWRNALNSFRKSLSDKDFKRIMIPAGPEDVVKEVEKWHRKYSASRHARVAAAVRAGVGRMQRFSASIDMLAQGSPSPGCLLWGSIKFALTVGTLLRSFAPAGIRESYEYCSWYFLNSLIDCARCCGRI